MADFLLEVGCEELPPKFLDSIIPQWNELIPLSLKELHIIHESLKIYTTPRRLAVIITGLSTHQESYVEEIKGPPTSIAFQGTELRAPGLKFMVKYSLDASMTKVQSTPKGDFLYGYIHHEGKLVSELLQDLVPKWIVNLKGDRFMCWGDGSMKFPRPITWLVALLDKEVLPITLVNGTDILHSQGLSKGHRVLYPKSISISSPPDYVSTLKSAFVEVCTGKRTHRIIEGINQLCDEVGGYTHIPESLLSELSNLVEWPTCVLGTFEKNYLSIPNEIISTILVKHQKYIPIYNQDYSTLLPHFITVSNGDPSKVSIIREGNEKVIRARLADGKFFYEQDIKHKPFANNELLDSVTYQEGFGTLLDQAFRVQLIASSIGVDLGCTKEQLDWITRASILCKNDLVTQVVKEFPELQGIMGSIYLNEVEEVCRAIKEHYDERPTSIVGQVVSIADRLDKLICLFSIGKVPTGSVDPYGLKGDVDSILNTIWDNGLKINLNDLLNHYGKHVEYKTLQTLKEFFMGRIKNLLEGKGYAYDVINSIMFLDTEETLKKVVNLKKKCDLVTELKSNPQFLKVREAFIRAIQLGNQGTVSIGELSTSSIINKVLIVPQEEELVYRFLCESYFIFGLTEFYVSNNNNSLLITKLLTLAPLVNDLIDSVLIMCEDIGVRTNRLNLLALVRNYLLTVCDFTKLNKT